jgi:hypothetical protein
MRAGGNPGVALNTYASTIGHLLENEELLAEFSARVRRLYRAIILTPTEQFGRLTAEELFGWHKRPMEIFIKSELHPRRKALNDEWRLIFNVPLIFKVVESFLIYYMDKWSIDCWDVFPDGEVNPFKPGMGFSPDQLGRLAGNFQSKVIGKRLVSIDTSSWDWSVTEPELVAEMYTRFLWSDQSPEAWRAMFNLAICLSRKTVLTSSGEAVHLPCTGIQPSGRQGTSSGNCIISLIVLAMVLGDRFEEVDVIAMGDDTIVAIPSDWDVAEFQESYGKFKPVRQFEDQGVVTPRGIPMEFCSKHIIPVVVEDAEPPQTLWVSVPVRSSLYKMIIGAAVATHHCEERFTSLLQELRFLPFMGKRGGYCPDWARDTLFSKPIMAGAWLRFYRELREIVFRDWAEKKHSPMEKRREQKRIEHLEKEVKRLSKGIVLNQPKPHVRRETVRIGREAEYRLKKKGMSPACHAVIDTMMNARKVHPYHDTTDFSYVATGTITSYFHSPDKIRGGGQAWSLERTVTVDAGSGGIASILVPKNGVLAYNDANNYLFTQDGYVSSDVPFGEYGTTGIGRGVLFPRAARVSVDATYLHSSYDSISVLQGLTIEVLSNDISAGESQGEVVTVESISRKISYNLDNLQTRFNRFSRYNGRLLQPSDTPYVYALNMIGYGATGEAYNETGASGSAGGYLGAAVIGLPNTSSVTFRVRACGFYYGERIQGRMPFYYNPMLMSCARQCALMATAGVEGGADESGVLTGSLPKLKENAVKKADKALLESSPAPLWGTLLSGAKEVIPIISSLLGAL